MQLPHPDPHDLPDPQAAHAPWWTHWSALPPARRAEVVAVARTLAEHGYRAWLVGGAVRDLVLGHGVGDLDMVSAATPDVALGLFPRARAIGKSFGIIQVDGAGESIELATFRLEEGYADGRHPDRVRFTDSLELDAKRRDFTCNALYFDPLGGELADPTGGMADLGAGVLRTVGEPSERFAEDGLRLLRVARFLARFDWQPAPGLLEAAYQARASLVGVSAERILGEFQRMANGPHPARALWALQQAGLLAASFGAGQAVDSPAEDRRLPLAEDLVQLRPKFGLVAWMVLGLDPDWTGLRPWSELQAEMAAGLERLRVPRGELAHTLAVAAGWRALLAWHLPDDMAAIVRCLRETTGPLVAQLAWIWAKRYGQPGDAERVQALRDWFASLPPERIRPRFLPNGTRWQALGVPQGPELGRCLAAVETAALEGRIASEAEALAWWSTHGPRPT